MRLPLPRRHRARAPREQPLQRPTHQGAARRSVPQGGATGMRRVDRGAGQSRPQASRLQLQCSRREAQDGRSRTSPRQRALHRPRRRDGLPLLIPSPPQLVAVWIRGPQLHRSIQGLPVHPRVHHQNQRDGSVTLRGQRRRERCAPAGRSARRRQSRRLASRRCASGRDQGQSPGRSSSSCGTLYGTLYGRQDQVQADARSASRVAAIVASISASSMP